MLEKLITNLKNSLPGAKKNADSEDSETVPDTDQEERGESEEGEETSSAEDEKKKKISMLIRVVVILGLGYTAVDHFFLSAEQEPSLEELTAAAPKKRKRPKPAVEKPAEEKIETPKSEAPVMAEPVATAEAPVEDINILDKNEPVQEEVPVKTEPVVAESPVLGEKAQDANLDQRLDQLIDNVDKKEETKEPNMADKIEEEVAYAPAPSYDVVGRGLVYNCKDKFWACIDKPGYVACNKNMKWNTSKGNAQECVVQNVYNSDEDCSKIQKYNVSTSQPTTFCQ